MTAGRNAHIERATGETKIVLDLKLDECGRGKISTGSGFLDHMLDLFQVHCGCTLDLRCDGDVEVDMHHSAEDIAICLGQALAQALGDKKGIERYGFYLLPMDDSLARVALDFSGRFACEFHASFASERIGIDAQIPNGQRLEHESKCAQVRKKIFRFSAKRNGDD